MDSVVGGAGFVTTVFLVAVGCPVLQTGNIAGILFGRSPECLLLCAWKVLAAIRCVSATFGAVQGPFQPIRGRPAQRLAPLWLALVGSFPKICWAHTFYYWVGRLGNFNRKPFPTSKLM